MKDNFARCLAFTLRFEGGRVDDPRDPGGRTNRGVTQASYDAWLSRQGRGRADVFAITPGEVNALYRDGYWNAVRADSVPGGVDLALFDFAVNSGPARALRTYGRRLGNDPAETVRHLCEARLSFLQALRGFRTFGRGWTARVAACEALGVQMAEQARIGIAPGAPVPAQVSGTLRATAKAAAATARRRARQAGAAGATGVAAHPAASGAGLPWPVLAALAGATALVVALLLWRSHQARRRAAAYAALAA